MAQLMQIQLQRFDAQPWGFRLQGGTDFAAPLVVQKINSGSLAEQAGLLPGDAVIKINDVDVYNLRHKDAQDLVVRSGNNFIVTVQRGGMTWRPSVTPTGQLPSPNPHSPYGQTVTKTSLAHKQQEVHHIGSGYNNSARPFNSVNGNDGQVKSIVNKQYNTPVGIYSDETIAETLSAQAEVLAGGVLGINFKKNEKQYSGDKSEVLKFLQEEETGEHEPEPRSPANFYWTHSHAIGGQRPSRPVTPASSKPHDERIGTPLQQNTLAPSASHRPSLPSHHPESRRGDAAEEKPPSTTTPTIDPRLIIAPVCPALQSPEYKAELEAAAIAAGVAPREQKPLTNLPQCAICGVGIVGVFVRIKDKNLHVECFKCATCGTSLKNQGYYNFNNKLYCDIHARLAASQNPPSGTEGYVPVPIKPNTKLSASTISAALNNIGYNGSPTNGTSTPLYSAPPSNIESTNISDLPLPPPPSPTQLQQFQIQDAFCNGNNLLTNTTLNNHSRTNSSLSTASSSSLSLSPYSSTNGINNNSSCSPINNNNAIIENSLNNHIGNPANNNNNNNNYNSTSTLSLDRFASSSSSSPGHSRQQSTSSSTGSGIITATDFQLPPPPPPPLPSSQQQQKHHQYNQIQQQLQQQQQQLNPNPNPMTINQSGKQNENDMNSNNRYASSGSNNPGSSIQTNGVGVNIGSGQGSAPSGGRADDSINSRTGQGQEGDQFQYVTCQGNVIRSVIPPGKGVSVNYKVNQGFARPYGAPAPAPAAAPKSPTSYPPPQVANQAGCNNNNNNNNWNQPRQIPVQHQQHQQQPASNMYATLPRSNAGPQEPNTNTTPKQTFPISSSTLPRMKPTIVKPPVGGSPVITAGSSQTSDATSMLSDSIGKITINNKNNFMAEAGKIISNMLESRLANNSKNNSTNDLTTLSGSTGNINTLTRSPMVVRKRFELEDFKNVDPTAPADLKPTQVVMPLEQLKVQQQPLKQNSVNIGLTGVGDGGLIQPNHHMKNLLDICDAKNLQNSGKNMMVPNQEVKVGLVTVPIPPPQLSVVQQKAQPQTPAAPPQPPAATQTPSNELIPLETVIFRNKNKRPNKGGELSTQANDRRSYIERDEPSLDNNPPVFEISVKPTRGNAADDDQGMDETKAVVSQLLKDGKRPICCQCDKEISRGPFITALGRIWCPDHFMCVNANCRRPLQDVGFVEEKGDLYCEYCFEKYLAPTCSKCSGKIKGDCLNAIGRHFHPECFTCAHCGKLFGNTPFFLEEGMAYCEADWNELFTTKCFACGFPVEAGDRWVEALGNNYHSQCFNCTYCKKNLEGQSFYNKGGRPFCKNHAR
ncbi:PDZ and LIM domain protein Zasp isoform X8 [Episyrphus balteatus]|uniref:PDZ and LIM domain protein Zasp isoform X8 n=1 Tax=Episyrphus balteatus TaxID=286459 RepID=UPI0024852E0B|nr:PDZ and LIM domain protein Zasp isoform X8 [Episyrphus balteatus]